MCSASWQLQLTLLGAFLIFIKVSGGEKVHYNYVIHIIRYINPLICLNWRHLFKVRTKAEVPIGVAIWPKIQIPADQFKDTQAFSELLAEFIGIV
jgi:hypothetical protein